MRRTAETVAGMLNTRKADAVKRRYVWQPVAVGRAAFGGGLKGELKPCAESRSDL